MAIGGVGQGTTLSFSVDTSAIGRIRSAQLPEFLAPAVDFTGLPEITWMKFLPGSPTDPGQMVLDIYFDTTMVLPTIRAVQTATITFPIMDPANSTNATLSASGFFTNLGFPNAQSAQPLMQGLTFKLDGIETVPAFTVETT